MIKVNFGKWLSYETINDLFLKWIKKEDLKKGIDANFKTYVIIGENVLIVGDYILVNDEVIATLTKRK